MSSVRLTFTLAMMEGSMETNNNTLGARLLAWRTALGLTQVQAGERSGCGSSNWRNWEKGRRVPSRGTLAHLESILADNTTTKQQ